MPPSDGDITVGQRGVNMDRPRERCAVVAIASTSQASYPLYFSLRALQHRGQEYAGIATFDGEAIRAMRNKGLVHEVFTQDGLADLKGNIGIAHLLYSIRLSKRDNLQPVIVNTPHGDMAIAHNGIIVNSPELRTILRQEGHSFFTDTEEEALVYLISKEMRRTSSIPLAIRNAMRRVNGSYSLVLIISGRIFALRDPLAIRPLCIGRFDDGYIVASESVAVDILDGRMIRDVRPGELIELMPDDYQSHDLFRAQHTAHCFFEWVYFARPDSLIEGIYGYDVRVRIGERLAREHPVDADFVSPIPDSGRAHAIGYARASGLQYKEALIKNRYIARTFIMPDRKEQQLMVKLKVNALRSVVNDMRVVIVDDSIVRGTTIRQIVALLRRKGAKEVHVRIGSPPLISPCYLGIDMTTRDQFIAHGKTVEEIRRCIGADTLGYISAEGLVESIGLPKEKLCMGCISGEYPLNIPNERLRFQPRIEEFILD